MNESQQGNFPAYLISISNLVRKLSSLSKNDFHKAVFLYFCLFYKQVTVNKCSIKVADDWIRTRVLWYWKRPLCQLRHNHCPIHKAGCCLHWIDASELKEKYSILWSFFLAFHFHEAKGKPESNLEPLGQGATSP